MPFVAGFHYKTACNCHCVWLPLHLFLRSLKHLAAVNGEPTADMQQPSAQAFPNPIDWSDFDDYVELVASNIMHNYVPLNPKMRLATSSKHPVTVNLSMTGPAAESAGHEAAMLLY